MSQRERHLEQERDSWKGLATYEIHQVRTLERALERAQAKLRYARAAAHVFPHVNSDRATLTQIGLPDAEDVWCLGCTIGSVIEEFDRELMGPEDETEEAQKATAMAWMRDYEKAEAARFDANEDEPELVNQDELVLEVIRSAMSIGHLVFGRDGVKEEFKPSDVEAGVLAVVEERNALQAQVKDLEDQRVRYLTVIRVLREAIRNLTPDTSTRAERQHQREALDAMVREAEELGLE